MYSLLSDPWFYAAALPAVILVGLSKGGFGGATALMGVPLMALVMPPVQAAAIMLPVLIVMDIATLWNWRGYRDSRLLYSMLPGALMGIGIGWLTAAIVTDGMVRLIVGLVALLFAFRYVQARVTRTEQVSSPNVVRGLFWATVAGFTSFVAHAGGPPYQIYTLPLRQDPKIYTGTSVLFFAVVNAVKLVPYFFLGQFDATNMAASIALVPVAIGATFIGAWIVRRMKPELFYPFMYAMVFLVALKLIWDGVFDIWV